MFDAEKRAFCFKMKASQGRLVQEGLSSRYTTIALLGLHQLEAAGFPSPIPVQPVLEGLLRAGSTIAGAGDVGLALWLCALVSPERLEEVYLSFGVQKALERSSDARERRTMELAWFLSGLAHAGAIERQSLPGLGDLALQTCQMLMENQGPRGPFGHTGRTATLAGVVRGKIGSFADQVYPIYALAQFARVFGAPRALIAAQRCADAICRAQGALGQWWWHYHSQTGRVLEDYPVYSVHQHGMAPMALFTLAEAAQVDFSEPVYKGLQWIAGENELAIDLRVGATGIVWRSIHRRSRYGSYLENAIRVIGFSEDRALADLVLNCECRPYELGWLLYAFAGRDLN